MPSKCSVVKFSDYSFFELLSSNNLESTIEWLYARASYIDMYSATDADIYIRLLAVKNRRPRLISASKTLSFDKFNEEGPEGLTLGHCFAWSGDLDELKRVLQLNLINKEYLTTNKKPTIWHYLALSGNWEALKLAIDEKLFDPKKLNDNESGTIWYWLARSGNFNALKKSIDCGLCDPKQLSKNGSSIWYGLAASGNFAALEQAINEGLLNPNELQRDENGYGLAHYLAKSCNIDVLFKASQLGWCRLNELSLKDETVWDMIALSGNIAVTMRCIDLGLFTGRKKTAVLNRMFATGDRRLLSYCISREFNLSEITIGLGEDLQKHFALLKNDYKYIYKSTDPALCFVWLTECLKNNTIKVTEFFSMMTNLLKKGFEDGKREQKMELIDLLNECCLLRSPNKYEVVKSLDIFEILLYLPEVASIDSLLELPMIKGASPVIIDKFINKALQRQQFELLNRCLRVPQIRNVAKNNSQFSVLSQESGLLLNLDDMDNGGDGNVSIEYKSYPPQNELIDKINQGLLPFFRDRKYDEKVLQEIERGSGLCLGLSFLFLFVMEQSNSKAEIDNIQYFERMLQLINDTDFNLLKTKKLNEEDNKLINDLDRFLQLVLLYQASIDINIVDKEEYKDQDGIVHESVRQDAVIFSLAQHNIGSKVDLGGVDPQKLFIDTGNCCFESLNKLSGGKIAMLEFDSITGSAFNCFFINCTGHTVAVKRDPENKDLFLVYDPNGFETIKKQSNPARIKAKYLASYLRDLIVFSYDTTLELALGFNMTKHELTEKPPSIFKI